MFGFIVSVLVVGLGTVLFLASRKPDEFNVTRSAVFHVPPAALFDHVNDLHKWQGWSPWAQMDPGAKIIFTGPQAGKDAGFSWAGNNKVGEGRLTIIESRPDELVRYRLDFKKPMAGTSMSEFTFAPDGADKTRVNWTMRGENNFMAKIMSVFMNCEKMVGDQFEQGLENIRGVVEKMPPRKAA